MRKYEESISDNSLWITATPTPFAKTLPFYISETGHFMAHSDYKIQRDTHDSFLLIYTVSGQGSLQTGNNIVQLPKGYCVIIDCHMPHEYHSISDKWEFLWIHFSGSGTAPLFDITYPSGAVRAVSMKHAEDFEDRINSIINEARQNDIAAYIHLSSHMHSVFNAVCLAALENDKVSIKHNSADDVRMVVEYIEKNYRSSITINDMIQHIHVSKYHFIRRFSRAMGITPYSYLTNYRINMSKMLLRSTNKTVSEIAEECGFLDTSNFITHFKKHTGQKPLQYRRDFS
ncbi:MAG: AraC family transcriptional regulator [bacterium]|nr:AraC family transcriptional regulator [bacterium]